MGWAGHGPFSLAEAPPVTREGGTRACLRQSFLALCHWTVVADVDRPASHPSSPATPIRICVFDFVSAIHPAQMMCFTQPAEGAATDSLEPSTSSDLC